jgi:hypothetical protein
MPQFETRIDAALEERICRMSADGLSAPAIYDVLSDELDWCPSTRSILRCIKRNEAAIAERATRDENVDPPPIPPALSKVRQRQAATRKRVTSSGEQYEQVHHPSVPVGAMPKIEKDPDTMSARERVTGVSDEEFERAQQRQFRREDAQRERRGYKLGEAILGEDGGVSFGGGMSIHQATMYKIRKYGGLSIEDCLMLAVYSGG